jgi:hypothetical protein
MSATDTSQTGSQLHHPPGGTTAKMGRAERIAYPESPRYRRIRSLSVLMDQSIVLPSGFRIGLDPILGLVPGVGEAVTTVISCYLVYQSALLGLPKRVLMRMVGNIALESLAGSVPIIGDLFDAVWKANMRNVRLLEQNYHPALPERSPRKIALLMSGVAAGLILIMGTAFYLVAKVILGAANLLFGF